MCNTIVYGMNYKSFVMKHIILFYSLSFSYYYLLNVNMLINLLYVGFYTFMYRMRIQTLFNIWVQSGVDLADRKNFRSVFNNIMYFWFRKIHDIFLFFSDASDVFVIVHVHTKYECFIFLFLFSFLRPCLYRIE